MGKDNIFLTFDVDWASDEILAETLNIIEKYEVSATFFMTHQTELLARMKANPAIEIGIHPNFNDILDGQAQGESAWNRLEKLMHQFPDSVSVRTHSLVQGSRLFDMFASLNISHDVSTYIPYHSLIELLPYRHWNDIIQVPFFWEDDVFCIEIKKHKSKKWEIRDLLQAKGIKVFNFHPIHVFLNTENLNRYTQSKEVHKNVELLGCHRYTGEGIRSFLEQLIIEAKNNSIKFKKIREIAI